MIRQIIRQSDKLLSFQNLQQKVVHCQERCPYIVLNDYFWKVSSHIFLYIFLIVGILLNLLKQAKSNEKGNCGFCSTLFLAKWTLWNTVGQLISKSHSLSTRMLHLVSNIVIQEMFLKASPMYGSAKYIECGVGHSSNKHVLTHGLARVGSS